MAKIHIIIVGGQGGGMTCAAKLSRQLPNCHITVIEKEDYISLGACGLPYYIEGKVKDSTQLNAKLPTDYINTNIDIKIKHSAISVNSAHNTVNVLDIKSNKTLQLSYNYLIIASGAQANILHPNHKRVSTLKNLHSANTVMHAINNLKIKNIALIGGGYIALELLEGISKQGIDITIIDSKKQITDKLLDNDFYDIVTNTILNNKINIIPNTRVTKITPTDNHVSITTQNATLNFDFVIQTMGSTPSTNFLGQEFNKINNGALIVNKFGKTNIHNVYACGDCVALKHFVTQKPINLQLATLSNKLAKVIADNITDEINNKPISSEFTSVLSSSALKLFNLEIAKTGITEDEAKLYNIPYKLAFVKDTTLPHYMENYGIIYGKIIFCPTTNAVLGAQIIGNQALQRINILSLAIQTKTNIQTLSTMDFGYTPTFNKTIDFINVLATVALKNR